MKRFFFDVAVGNHVDYDYRGRDLARAEDAREFAELIALDLGSAEEAEGQNLEIQVRSPNGTRLFSVPIPQADRIAA